MCGLSMPGSIAKKKLETCSAKEKLKVDPNPTNQQSARTMVESIDDDLEKGLGAGVAAVAEPSAAAFSPRSFPCWHIWRVSASSQRQRALPSRRRPEFTAR
jgi:hypothetical protein